MQMDLFNIDDFVKANHCPEVTNPIFFSSDGTPTTDGLFSYELFGFSDEDRKNIFGYIDLKGNFVHPLVYLIMTTKMGSLGKILTGEKYGVIADKKIKIVPEDTPNAETGIDFVYDNFEHIDWVNEIEEDEIDSLDKKTRLKFIKSLKKNEFFVTKWLVLPPYYRAESSQNRSMGDSINKLYKELISKVKGMNLGFSFSVFGAETKLRIQNILKDLYLSTLAPVSGKNLILTNGISELAGSGKNSMVRKHLLGKTVDWTASSVITSPLNSNANRESQKPCPFGYGSFPLATLLSMFQPFFMEYCSTMLETLLNDFYVKNIQQNSVIKKLDPTQFNGEEIESMIKKFIKGSENRLEPILFTYTRADNNKKDVLPLPIFEYKTLNDSKKHENYVARPMTYTDLFYIAAQNCLKDKHIYVTRYPVTNFQNIYPSKIKVLSTNKTRKLWISFGPDSLAEYYEDYPYINPEDIKDSKSELIDVTLIGNAYLSSIGGDYDGDMVYMRAVFTQEANEEAERLIYSKTNFMDAKGGLTRGLASIGRECILGLYELTKDHA